MGFVGHICETPDGRYLEIPDTLPDWHATLDELASLLLCEVGKPPVTLVTPYGDMTVNAVNNGLSGEVTTLWVDGDLTVGGFVYAVGGPVGGIIALPQFRDLAHPDEWAVARGLTPCVVAATERNDGAHVGLYALHNAWDAITRAGWGSRDFTQELNDSDRAAARRCLQELAAADLPPFPRTVAFRMACDGYAGTVQELRDDATALTRDVSEGAQKTALAMLGAGFAGTAEELLVAAQALDAAPAYSVAP